MVLSVVIPAHDEAGNLPYLLHEIRKVLSYVGAYEVVVVDDGSSDSTQSVLDDIQADFPQLRIVRHASSCGQSTALMTGIDAATGDIIATLDGDGQNDPADIPGMVDLLLQSRRTDDVQMIAGVRSKRRDSRWRLVSSRIANGVRSRILHDETPDSGCGIKVFLKQAFEIMPRFNHMHRPRLQPQSRFPGLFRPLPPAARNTATNYSSVKRPVAWSIRSLIVSRSGGTCRCACCHGFHSVPSGVEFGFRRWIRIRCICGWHVRTSVHCHPGSVIEIHDLAGV